MTEVAVLLHEQVSILRLLTLQNRYHLQKHVKTYFLLLLCIRFIPITGVDGGWDGVGHGDGLRGAPSSWHTVCTESIAPASNRDLASWR